MKLIKKLKGNSGCNVSLIQDKERGLIVRKSASSVDYNPRLKLQFFKQSSFQHKLVSTPKVFGLKDDSNNLLYFDMEYIRGESFHNFISTHAPFQSLKILKNLLSIHTLEGTLGNNEAVNQKIDALRPYKNYSRLLDYCADFEWSDLPTSNCHGDLSLENIIIKNNTPYLIDFLDSFIESRFIDLSKLSVDLMFGWSWRGKNNFPFIKNIIILQELQKDLTEQEKEIYKRLTCLQLLRILPYSNDNSTKDFLNKSLSHILQHHL